VFTEPLPSNKHPIVARWLRGNVFTESLPSNGSISHIILNAKHVAAVNQQREREKESLTTFDEYQ
jgi:hypothetical protein